MYIKNHLQFNSFNEKIFKKKKLVCSSRKKDKYNVHGEKKCMQIHFINPGLDDVIIMLL